MGVWSILPLIIKCILDIKRIFRCSFGNKYMRLLTRAYGIRVRKLPFSPEKGGVRVNRVYELLEILRYICIIILSLEYCVMEATEL